MIVDSVENAPRYLRAGAVIEEDQAWFLVESREERTDAIGWEVDGLGCDKLLFDHVAPGAW
jgi:hypothetical protein